MTRSRTAARPLGQWLMVAFTVVAIGTVAVLTGAALIATDRGLATADTTTREQVATRAAQAAGAAYRHAGGWAGVDLSAAQSIAQAAGAQLVIRDTNGATVYPGRAPARSGTQAGEETVTASVQFAGQPVGILTLVLPPGPPAGRVVAWDWIWSAAGVGLLLALGASWYVSRRLGAPLAEMTRAARAFTAGDRAARVRVRAPGEVGELGRALDAMADQVVHAEQARRQFSADVARELATPLAALRAGLAELLDGTVPADAARLAALHEQSACLGQVAQDLADLAATDAAGAPRPTDTTSPPPPRPPPTAGNRSCAAPA